MFIGREREISSLQGLYDRDGFQMPVLYGRRRVGKTRLIREFCKGKPVIFYTATQDEAATCLRNFTASIREYDRENALLHSMEAFPSWDSALDYILSLSKGKRLVVVIDEFPYLAKAFPAISSILQRCIDTKWKESNLFLILSGSSKSFMEKQVLGYESPLYGRRTAQIRLQKLDYSDSIRFFPDWSREDALYAYGACDGIPQYLSIFSKWGSFREAVEHEFLTETGGLLDEPAFLLKEELREPALYNSIVEAVADGFNRSNEIASRVGKTVNALLPYLSNLISLQILERQSPVENTSVKKNVFRVQDKLFLFWYRFIPKCRVQIAMGLVEEAFEKKIQPYLAEYFGHVFEDICLQYIQRKTMNREIETVFDEYGKWWGTNQAKKCQEEIDLVCVNSEEILVGECKWQSEPIGYGVWNTLVERGKLVRNNRKIRYYLFSKSGFEQKLSEAKEDGLTLVDLGEIISPMAI